MSKWYNAQGGNIDTVLSSRVTLVRNLDKVPFPCRMSNDLRKSVCKRLYASIQNSKFAGEFDLFELDKLNDLKRISLVEKGLISTKMAKQSDYGAVLISKDESMSIMLCEENHISIASTTAGQDLYSAFKKANEIDDIFISNNKIAFDDELGFLTSNPMQLGTGMRASLLLHLPAISEKGMLLSLNDMLLKLGFSVKSVFGEGSFYEMSNEISLGITEKSALDNLNAICDQIIKQERALRQELIEYHDFEDKIYRAMGTLKMARKLSTNEFFSLISLARLGISMSAFDNNLNETYESIGELMYSLGTATIMDGANEGFTVNDADKLRAQYVRDKLQ